MQKINNPANSSDATTQNFPVQGSMEGRTITPSNSFIGTDLTKEDFDTFADLTNVIGIVGAVVAGWTWFQEAEHNREAVLLPALFLYFVSTMLLMVSVTFSNIGNSLQTIEITRPARQNYSNLN